MVLHKVGCISPNADGTLKMSNNGEYFNTFLAASNGSINANADYSSADDDFEFIPTSGSTYTINRLIVTIADIGISQFENYGEIAQLGSGVQVFYDSEGTTFNLTADLPILDNGHWASYCHDVIINALGGGSTYVTIRWDFEQAGTGILLAGSPDKFYVRCRDDLSGLLSHRFQIQGYRNLR